MINRLAIVTVCVGVCAVSFHSAAETDDIDRELVRLKNEIRRVQGQRNSVAKEMKKEQEDFDAYNKRTAERKHDVLHRTDSIKEQLRSVTVRNDSLESALSAVSVKLKEEELRRKRFRGVLHDAVISLADELPGFPPLIRTQYTGPIGYLAGELDAGSIDNTEALYRLMRIVQDLRTVSQEIQVVEGSSPFPEMRGTVYRLRIGAVFEAAVDEKGKRAFVWNSAAVGEDAEWVEIEDPVQVVSLFNAVKMREGKTMPDLVDLPFTAGASSGGKGGDDDDR